MELEFNTVTRQWEEFNDDFDAKMITMFGEQIMLKPFEERKKIYSFYTTVDWLATTGHRSVFHKS